MIVFGAWFNTYPRESVRRCLKWLVVGCCLCCLYLSSQPHRETRCPQRLRRPQLVSHNSLMPGLNWIPPSLGCIQHEQVWGLPSSLQSNRPICYEGIFTSVFKLLVSHLNFRVPVTEDLAINSLFLPQCG